MKPLSKRSKWIYGTHNFELGPASYGILKMLQVAKLEVVSFHGSEPNLSRDIHHIWSEFFDSWKEYVQPPIYM
jgi:hypothetical protein